MSKDKFSFRWGIETLDDEGGIYLYGFMLRNYAKIITHEEFLCLVHLAAYHYESRKGESSPSHLRIAKEMGYKNKNSVLVLVHSLESKGMLEIEKRPGFTCAYNAAKFATRMLELAGSTEFNTSADSMISTSAESMTGDVTENAPKEEEKKKNLKKKKIYTPKAKPSPDPMLRIDSIPEGPFLFEQISIAAKSKGQIPPEYFSNPQQRDQFQISLSKLNGNSHAMILKGIAQRGRALSTLGAWLEACAKNQGKQKYNQHSGGVTLLDAIKQSQMERAANGE